MSAVRDARGRFQKAAAPHPSPVPRIPASPEQEAVTQRVLNATDGVAMFAGRIIGRVGMTKLPHDGPKWAWSVTDPELAGRPGWANTTAKCPRAGRPWPA